MDTVSFTVEASSRTNGLVYVLDDLFNPGRHVMANEPDAKDDHEQEHGANRPEGVRIAEPLRPGLQPVDRRRPRVRRDRNHRSGRCGPELLPRRI